MTETPSILLQFPHVLHDRQSPRRRATIRMAGRFCMRKWNTADVPRTRRGRSPSRPASNPPGDHVPRIRSNVSNKNRNCQPIHYRTQPVETRASGQGRQSLKSSEAPEGTLPVE